MSASKPDSVWESIESLKRDLSKIGSEQHKKLEELLSNFNQDLAQELETRFGFAVVINDENIPEIPSSPARCAIDLFSPIPIKTPIAFMESNIDLGTDNLPEMVVHPEPVVPKDHKPSRPVSRTNIHSKKPPVFIPSGSSNTYGPQRLPKPKALENPMNLVQANKALVHEEISLARIDTDDEDLPSRSKSRRPLWAVTPVLAKTLKMQEKVDPNLIFGSVPSEISIDKVFNYKS